LRRLSGWVSFWAGMVMLAVLMWVCPWSGLPGLLWSNRAVAGRLGYGSAAWLSFDGLGAGNAGARFAAWSDR